MTTVVQHFLGSLRRSFSNTAGGRITTGQPAMIYRVTAANEPFLGKHLGGCTLVERTGQGSFSVLYKGVQDGTERVVAVKMLRVQLCIDPTNVKRFEREAKAISRLCHPNLLTVHHVDRTPTGQPFIVMEFVEGRSLGEILQAEGPLKWERAMNIFAQVCDAMQHAHEKGVIHRDLKPDNIMIVKAADGSDLVKVVDFGVVKITDQSQRLSQKLTQTGEVWGSPMYMSPEQCSGKELDARSDIYSLGTVIYECLTGQTVFSGKHVTELIMRQLVSEPKPFSQICPQLNLPAWLEAVVLKSLEKERSRRFKSMYEFKKALQPLPLKLATSIAGACQESAEAEVADPFIGSILSDCYVVESFIGEGGMSHVYKAVHQKSGQLVAVKILRSELCVVDSYVKRFEREAKSLGRVAHPNLISIYEVGTTQTGQPYMVIEYLDGRSLRDVIIDEGAMPVERALPMFTQICQVMEFAHKQGVIHRDLKPHNIMLIDQNDAPQMVKVVDFGIVKLDESIVSVSQKLTASGEICGSPMYMSPEQILDEPLDARTDIYSLGAVMFEVLTGRPLFSGTKITEVMHKHVNVPPPPLNKVRPDLEFPADLDTIVRRCLSKHADQRFATMSAVREALGAINMQSGKTSLPDAQHILRVVRESAAHANASGARLRRSKLNDPTPWRMWFFIVSGIVLLAIGSGLVILALTKPPSESIVNSKPNTAPAVHHDKHRQLKIWKP